jgi:hypothetical protein
MLVIYTPATRKDKEAGKPNLRETHRGGLTLVPIVISINKSPVGIPGEQQENMIRNIRDK